MKKYQIFSNKTYDLLQWGVRVFMPALIFLIAGIGELLGYDVTIIIGMIGLIGVFIGALMGISKGEENDNE